MKLNIISNKYKIIVLFFWKNLNFKCYLTNIIKYNHIIYQNKVFSSKILIILSLSNNTKKQVNIVYEQILGSRPYYLEREPYKFILVLSNFQSPLQVLFIWDLSRPSSTLLEQKILLKVQLNRNWWIKISFFLISLNNLVCK